MTALPLLETRLRRVTLADIQAVDLREARRYYASVRVRYGFDDRAGSLLTAPDSNSKISRSSVLTWSLFLAPHESSGVVNVCPWATPECIDLCLNTAGRATFDPGILRARQAKTVFAAERPAMFLALLRHEIIQAMTRRRGKRCRRRKGLRLNGTADIRWELIPGIADLLTRWQYVTPYDYTKAPVRARLEVTYDVTLSASERWTDDDIDRHLDDGHRVAIVAEGMPDKGTPVTWRGRPAVDGDLSDYRPSDKKGVAVLLRPKGRARKHHGGFVRPYTGA